MSRTITSSISLNKVPTLDDLQAVNLPVETIDGSYTKEKKTTSPTGLWRPFQPVNKLWDDTTKHPHTTQRDSQSHVSSKERPKRAYVVEWGYFVDPDKIQTVDRHRPHFRNIMSPGSYLNSIKEMGCDMFTGENFTTMWDSETITQCIIHRGLVRTIIGRMRGKRWKKRPTRIVFVLVTLMTMTLGGYSLMKI